MAEPSYVKVKCADCENEQIVFTRPSSKVSCQVCGATMVEPTGGKGKFKGEIVETIE